VTKTKIFIVEDDTLLRDGLVKLINEQEDMEVAGVTANADKALDMCRKLAPDLALIDVLLEGSSIDGIEEAAEIRRELPKVKIVIMTAYPEMTFKEDARNAGAHSFIYKNAGIQHVLYVIRRTMNGQGSYDEGKRTLPKFPFTEIEIEIIRLVGQHKNRKEISEKLNASEGTIKGYNTKILNKAKDVLALDKTIEPDEYDKITQGITEFALYALANGLILPGYKKNNVRISFHGEMGV